MERERFEHLLDAEAEGNITAEERKALDAACASDPNLLLARKADQRSIAMLRNLGGARAPQGFAHLVLERIENEILAEEAPIRRQHAYQEDEDFESRMTRKREASRRESRIASSPLGFLASPFLRFGFGFAVIAIFAYMGSVIVRESQRSGRSLLPDFNSGSNETSGLAVSETEPKEFDIAAASRRNNAAGTITTPAAPVAPAPPIDVEIAALDQLVATPAQTPPPAEETEEETDESETEIAETDMAEEEEAEPEEIVTAAAAPSKPAPQPTIPDIELPEAVKPMEKEIASVAPAKNVAEKAAVEVPASQAKSNDERGMEDVFGRIREDMKKEDKPAAPATAEPAKTPRMTERVVANAAELRAEFEKMQGKTSETDPNRVSLSGGTASDPKIVNALADSKSVAKETPSMLEGQAKPKTEVVTEVDELREALKGQTKEKSSMLAQADPKQAAPATARTSGILGATISKTPAGATLPSPPKPTAETARGLKSANAKDTATVSALRQVEMSIARQGGKIVRRAADTKDPSRMRVTARLTRDQLVAMQKDLERQGIRASKTSQSLGSENYYFTMPKVSDSAPVDVEILVNK